MRKVIRIGSRESALALAQTNWVINEIKKKFPFMDFEIIAIKTKGDVILDTRLDKIGGKGLFIKELEQALIEEKIDMAVHSLKDMPAELPEELAIPVVSKREDPRDVLVTDGDISLNQLNASAVIGTSSVRREVQIQQLRPDLKFKTLRGNVLTRLNKLIEKQYDGLILAAAGLKRLGLEEKCVGYFEIDEMIPAVGQGVLAIETRKNEDIDYLLESVHNETSACQVAAERSFMIALNGGCTTPIAAHAVITEDHMKVYGMMASQDGKNVYKEVIEGNKRDADILGKKLANRVLEKMNQSGRV